MAAQSYTIDVPQDVLDDLQARLARTRWPDEVEGAGWDYGTNLGFMQQLAAYWQQGYDWRAQEAQLNRLAHFHTVVDDFGLHFIHERGKGANPIPLLLLHGWPDSFYRFTKVIPMLTDPAAHSIDAPSSFDVVVPSLPGFGFSDKPLERGGVYGTVALLFKLMTDVLGYSSFAVHGGDTGSWLAKELAKQYPDHVMAVHITDIGWDATLGLEPTTETEAVQAYLAQNEAWSATNGAYYMIQGTKPQSLAYGLTDSPVGMAAWILQHFHAWSDCDGDLERCYSKDELLTNIMIYWVTQTFNSSIRWYYDGMNRDEGAENSEDAADAKPSPRVEVPVGLALFPKDLPGMFPPRELAERTLNIQHWSEMPRGGHFAALEEPELLAQDMHTFFSRLR